MRPIDADDLIKVFESLELMSGQYPQSFTNMVGNRSMEIEYAKDYIDNAKTIDSVPVVHAHWELASEDTAYDNVWICSNCGEDFTQHRKPKFIYCPNCGAKMDEEDVDQIKRIEAEPVKHAHWVACEDEYEDEYKCSACGGIQFFAMTPQDEGWEYCPHCGAKMNEVEE